MFVIVFIDDILMYSRLVKDHANHLQQVLPILRERKLDAKFVKSEFWFKTMAFLGYILSEEGIQVDNKKTKR